VLVWVGGGGGFCVFFFFAPPFFFFFFLFFFRMAIDGVPFSVLNEMFCVAVVMKEDLLLP